MPEEIDHANSGLTIEIPRVGPSLQTVHLDAPNTATVAEKETREERLIRIRY